MNGLFVLGVPSDQYRLPHPQLSLPIILVVRRVLIRAFELLRQQHGSLLGFKEDEITAALRAIIENDLRQSGSVEGFSTQTFETVQRQAEAANFDQTKLSKTPDLCFKLRADEEEPRYVLSEYDALFVECKPIDKTHAAGSKYCDLGLCRFVDGDYAWAMEEGLMLGYARHGRTIATHLSPAIQQPQRWGRLKVEEEPQPIEKDGAGEEDATETLHISRHRRGFPWPEDKGPASDILVYHSWHNCD